MRIEVPSAIYNLFHRKRSPYRRGHIAIGNVSVSKKSFVGADALIGPFTNVTNL